MDRRRSSRAVWVVGGKAELREEIREICRHLHYVPVPEDPTEDHLAELRVIILLDPESDEETCVEAMGWAHASTEVMVFHRKEPLPAGLRHSLTLHGVRAAGENEAGCSVTRCEGDEQVLRFVSRVLADRALDFEPRAWEPLMVA